MNAAREFQGGGYRVPVAQVFPTGKPDRPEQLALVVIDPFKRRLGLFLPAGGFVLKGVDENHRRLADFLQRDRRQMECDMVAARHGASVGGRNKLFRVSKARLYGRHEVLQDFSLVNSKTRSVVVEIKR